MLKIIFCDIFKSAEKDKIKVKKMYKVLFFTQQWPDNLFTTLPTHEVQTGMSYLTPTLNSAAITFHNLLHLK